MKAQRAFLWPRLVVGIRSTSHSLSGLRSLLQKSAVDCLYEDGQTLLADISHWQINADTVSSAEAALARLQHLLNQQLSPLHYSLGIGSEAVWAYHAADNGEAGEEKWVLPWQIKDELKRTPITALRVIDNKMPYFFSVCGKQYCDELVEFGKDFLLRRFGTPGEMLWCLLNGRFCQYPNSLVSPDGNISWRLSLPVRTRSVRSLSAHLWRLYTTVSRNLERLNRQAEQLDLKYQGSDETGFHQPAMRLRMPLRNRRDFNHHLEKMNIDKNGIAQFQITAYRLSHPAGQLDLF